MTKDIEREAFESNIAISEMLRDTGVEFSIDKNEYFHSMYTTFVPEDIHFLNGAWWMYQEQNQKLEGCVVVPESELKDTFYWPDSEYVVDCPFDYDFELDKGEIQVIEKWQRTKSTKIYFANIYKDEESFEIKEFPSLEAAQEAVKENNAYLEAEEFFNLAEAARGGNE